MYFTDKQKQLIETAFDCIDAITDDIPIDERERYGNRFWEIYLSLADIRDSYNGNGN